MWGTYYGRKRKPPPPQPQATLRCVCIAEMHMSRPGGDTEECTHRVICSRSALVLTATEGGRASSLRKHAEQCVFSAPILNSRSRGSPQLYVMKTSMALKGSVLLIMNIQRVLSRVHWLCQHPDCNGHLGHGVHVLCIYVHFYFSTYTNTIQYKHHLLRRGIY